MANLVPPLDDSRSYIYCPACAKMGNGQVEMKRDTYQFKCPMFHSYSYAEIQRMIASGQVVEMVPTQIIENPLDSAIPCKIFLQPETWKAAQTKWAGRFHITVENLFALAVSDSVIYIEGEDVKELRLRGVKTGRDVLAALKAMQELERERDELQKQLSQLMPLLKPILAAANGVESVERTAP